MNSPETAMWRGVVVQAIVDATTRVTTKSAPIIKLERDHARAWLLTDRRGFLKVCEMGSLEPSAVRSAMQVLALDGWRKPLWVSVA